MTQSNPLPAYLVTRFQGWKATGFAENKAWYRRLASEGQRPRAMIISCCDSRVNVSTIFGADHGEFFIHRNIANLVPPYETDGQQHGTSAAIEYAVTSLKVAHLIVVGHSACGGIQGFYDMMNGRAPELTEETSFVGRWMGLLKPGYERIKEDRAEPACIDALEKEAVKLSLDNLMTFPFVQAEIESENLMLHGLWHDIGEGELLWYDSGADTFKPL